MREVEALEEVEARIAEVSGLSIEDLWREAEGQSVDLKKSELAAALLAIGAKYNYGLAPGIAGKQAQIAAFFRALQLRELALAQACALGRELAWQHFVRRFREPLKQAAIAITGSGSRGEELSDSLYSEMFGLASKDGQRRSPLASYAGRGSLLGFLRTTLAQRQVDQQRRTKHETQIDGRDFPAAVQAAGASPEMLARLAQSLSATMGTLDDEERLLLSAWYLDERTLLEIAAVLRVHEATVSRKVKRLTGKLRKELLKNLQKTGMSKQAAEEALGTDPRDLTINLRSLLQTPASGAILSQRPEPQRRGADSESA